MVMVWGLQELQRSLEKRVWYESGQMPSFAGGRKLILLISALCMPSARRYQWAKQGRGAVVLPLRCLGSDLVGSRRPSAEGCIARAENFMAGRDPWGWSNQSGLPGGSGAGPGRMGKAEVVRKGWVVSRLFLSGSSPSSSSLNVSQVQPCFLNPESSFLVMGIPGHLHKSAEPKALWLESSSKLGLD